MTIIHDDDCERKKCFPVVPYQYSRTARGCAAADEDTDPSRSHAGEITVNALFVAALGLNLAVTPVRIELGTDPLLIALPGKVFPHIHVPDGRRRPILELYRIGIILLGDDGYVQGQALDNETVIFVLEPGRRGAFLLSRDIVDRPGELVAVEVDHDATLQKVVLVETEGVVVVCAVFVVGEGEFAGLIWFLGEVELVRVAVTGVGCLAVFDVPALAISVFDLTTA